MRAHMCVCLGVVSVWGGSGGGWKRELQALVIFGDGYGMVFRRSAPPLTYGGGSDVGGSASSNRSYLWRHGQLWPNAGHLKNAVEGTT